jgi:DNA polymerase III epsilon subunit-like protein
LTDLILNPMSEDRRHHSLCFLDTETSNTKPDTGEIIDIGLLRIDYPKDWLQGGEEQVVGRFSSKIKPTKPVDPSAAKINGYNPLDWVDAPPLNEALLTAYPLIEGAQLANWNINFDRNFLQAAFDRWDWWWPKGVGYRTIDVQTLARPYILLHWPEADIKKIQMGDVARKLGLLKEDEAFPHSGMADAELAAQMYKHFMRLYFKSLA